MSIKIPQYHLTTMQVFVAPFTKLTFDIPKEIAIGTNHIYSDEVIGITPKPFSEVTIDGLKCYLGVNAADTVPEATGPTELFVQKSTSVYDKRGSPIFLSKDLTVRLPTVFKAIILPKTVLTHFSADGSEYISLRTKVIAECMFGSTQVVETGPDRRIADMFHP